MRRIKCLEVCLVVTGIFAATQIAWAATYTVTDPGGLGSVINPLGVAIVQEAGNYGIDEFNSHPHRLVLTFELDDGFGPSGDQLSTVTLTEAVSGVDLLITFDVPRDANGIETGWGRITTDFKPTSGEMTLAYKSMGSAKIIFDRGVYGVGLTLNRLHGDCKVRIYDVSDVEVDPNFIVMANGGDGHSFFGYYNPHSPEVGSIEFGLEGNSSQFAIDDVAVIASTEGLAECFGVAMRGDLDEDCYVDIDDLQIMAFNWLECNEPDDPACWF